MLRAIVEWSLKSRFVVVVLAAVLMTLGVSRLRHMPLDVLPEFAPPYVEIQTESLGLSAEEVEQLITTPMEQDLLNGVPWLDTIRSESVPGLSSIVLIFEPGTELMRARQMVSERLTQAVALPHVSKPPTMLQPLSATSRVVIVGLSSKTLTPIQMSILSRWTIAPRLMGVPGVANVAIWGQRDRQLQVQVDPKRLAEHKISLLSVLETTGNALWVSSLSFVEASTPGTGGFIDTSNQRLGIRHILPIVSADGLSQVPIENSSLRLGDVANVVEDHQPLIGDALTNAGPGLLLVIEKFPGANALEVTRGVEEALAELGPGLPGLDVDTNIFRPADFIEEAMHNIGVALIAGLGLVLLALAVFYGDWRRTLISLVVVPLSLVGAGLVLDFTGATLNVIVLTGLIVAIGAVVYDAVAGVDIVSRRLHQPRPRGSEHSTADVVLAAALEARSSIVYAMLILLLTVLPIYFMSGPRNELFRPLAVSYAMALLVSMVIALTVTPALCWILLANAPPRRSSPFVSWLERRYDPALSRFIPRRGVAWAGLAILAILGVGSLAFIDRSPLPAFKERNLLIHLVCRPGTSQPEMSRIAGRVCSELRAVPGIRNVGAHIGRAVLGDQVVNVNSAEVWISIDPAADYDRTTATIQDIVDGYPGVAPEVQTYLRQRSSDVAPEPNDNIVVRVYGDADAALRAQAENVRTALTGVGGIVGLEVQLPIEQATLETEVDLTAAQRYGLKPGDVRRAAATLLSGIQVGSLFEEQKVFDVVVWSTPETRHSLSDVNDLLIDTPSGGHVRLGDVAKVRIVPTASVVRHESVKRYIDVVADVHGRNLDAVAADIRGRLHHLQFPLEYHARVLGGYAMPHAARMRLWTLVVAGVIGAYFLLQAAFSSWRLALLAFVALPVTLVGGLLVGAAGGTMSLGALAGLLVVLGISTCNLVMLLSHYQYLERHEHETLGPELVRRAGRERLPVIVLTSVAAVLAIVPSLLLGDAPGLETLRPMAFVVLGGMVTSLLVILWFVPAIFWSLRVSSRQEVAQTAPAKEYGRLAEAGGMAAGD